MKVVENSQRDINIAFMNELAMVFDRMDIDTNETPDMDVAAGFIGETANGGTDGLSESSGGMEGLSAASLSRGLDNPGIHTNYTDVKFARNDYIAMVLATIFLTSVYLLSTFAG